MRQREDRDAWFDLREHGQRVGVGGVNDVADVDLPEPDDAVDRCDNRRVIELGPRGFDRGLIGVDGGLVLIDLGLLRVQVLHGLGVLAHQGAKSHQILLGVDELRLVLPLFRNGLVERRLQRRRIDLGEHIALVHVLTLAKIDRNDLTVDLGADCHGIQGHDGAEGIIIDRNILAPRRGRGHGNGRSRGARGGRPGQPLHGHGGNNGHNCKTGNREYHAPRSSPLW